MLALSALAANAASPGAAANAASNAASIAAAPASTAGDAGVAYITNERGGVSVIDLATLTVRQQMDTGTEGPRGLGITPDGRWLLTANKASGDISQIDARTGQLVRRIKIGPNPEFIRVRGELAYVSYEPSSEGKPAAAGGAATKNDKADTPPKPAPHGKPDDDDDNDGSAEVAVVDLKTWKVIKKIKSGKETEGIEFSRDGKTLLVTNEGDQTVTQYDRATGKLIQSLDTSTWGKRPRGIKALPDGSGYVVTLEFSDKFIVLDAKLSFRQEVATGQSPYGVSFDPSGQRLYVAAAKSDRIDVFDGQSFAPIAQLPVGKRCWHFSFSPDGDRLIVACGRSDAVYVIHTPSYDETKVLRGFNGPWGVVTYPKARGSLDDAR